MIILILLSWSTSGTGYRIIYKDPSYSPKYEVWADKFQDLQTAIDYLEQEGGGVIKLSPNQIYKIENPPLTITEPYISILSKGNSTIEIMKDTVGIDIASGTNYINLKGFTLKAPQESSYSGIKFYNSHDIYMDNVSIRDFGGSGINVELIWGSTFNRVNVYNNGKHGWDIRSGTSNIWINCYVAGIDSVGFRITSWYSTLISCSADNVKYCAYMLRHGPASAVANVSIINSGAEHCDGYVLILEGAKHCNIIGMNSTNCSKDVDVLVKTMIGNYGRETKYCTISNMNNYDALSPYGFDIQGGGPITMINVGPVDVDSARFKNKEALIENIDEIMDYK